MDLTNKVIALTGAGSGIGRGTALALAERGALLELSDVDEAGLEETASLLRDRGADPFTELVDVKSAEAVDAWAQDIADRRGAADGIINNAGVTLVAEGRNQSHDDIAWVMDINFWGVVHGTRAFLPAMLERGSGHIVNISSIFGLFGVATQSAYCASKFAVRGYSESLRVELRDSGVGMTVVHPGGVRTNIVNSSRFALQGEASGSRDEVNARYNQLLDRTDPAKAGELICKAMENNKARLRIGPDAYIVDWLQRLLPVRFPLMGVLIK